MSQHSGDGYQQGPEETIQMALAEMVTRHMEKFKNIQVAGEANPNRLQGAIVSYLTACSLNGFDHASHEHPDSIATPNNQRLHAPLTEAMFEAFKDLGDGGARGNEVLQQITEAGIEVFQEAKALAQNNPELTQPNTQLAGPNHVINMQAEQTVDRIMDDVVELLNREAGKGNVAPDIVQLLDTSPEADPNGPSFGDILREAIEANIQYGYQFEKSPSGLRPGEIPNEAGTKGQLSAIAEEFLPSVENVNRVNSIVDLALADATARGRALGAGTDTGTPG